MKKSKRKPSKAQRDRQAALNSVHLTMEQLTEKLNALGDFDANAPHIRCVAAAVTLLYRDRLKRWAK